VELCPKKICTPLCTSVALIVWFTSDWDVVMVTDGCKSVVTLWRIYTCRIEQLVCPSVLTKLATKTFVSGINDNKNSCLRSDRSQGSSFAVIIMTIHDTGSTSSWSQYQESGTSWLERKASKWSYPTSIYAMSWVLAFGSICSQSQQLHSHTNLGWKAGVRG